MPECNLTKYFVLGFLNQKSLASWIQKYVSYVDIVKIVCKNKEQVITLSQVS